MVFRSWFLIAALAAAGCGGYDAPPQIVTRTLTHTPPPPPATAATFQPLRTYYLDPLIEVWQDGEAQVSQPVPSSTVTTITTNMTRLGYTRVTTDPGPGIAPAADVGIRIAYLKTSFSYYYGGSY